MGTAVLVLFCVFGLIRMIAVLRSGEAKIALPGHSFQARRNGNPAGYWTLVIVLLAVLAITARLLAFLSQ